MVFGVLLTFAASPRAQEGVRLASVTWVPARAEEGTLAEVHLRAESGAVPEIDSVSGVAAGEPLHFEPDSNRSFWAVVPVPLSAPETLHVTLVLQHGAEPLGGVIAGLPVEDRREATQALTLPAPFNAPPDSATAARLASEATLLDSLYRHAHDVPRLWHDPFLRPVPGRVTAAFGVPRVIDGMSEPPHGGVDLAGPRGSPVHAANRGIVALVTPLYESGLTVVLYHGGGLVTIYAHLSLATVVVGDTIPRGHVLGLVGSTGRATGPHLHWAAHYGALAVDPLSLLTLKRR